MVISSFFSQKKDEKNRQVGFLVGSLVPINYFGVGPLEVSENNSSISLNNELINKPSSREEAFAILKRLNNSKHYLISSACIAKNGAMVWNNSDTSELKMKNLSDNELSFYLNKIETKTLMAYGVYQIEADGLELFEYVKGDKDSIMGLPIKEIINYISQIKK